MLKDVIWTESRSYRSGGSNPPFNFYLQSLCSSERLDLLLGYFSSAAINVLSAGFATFLYKGGNVRMVINHVLSQEDRDAIHKAQVDGLNNNVLDLTDIKNLKRSLDDYGRHFFECLTWLVVNNKIQLKIVRPLSKKGISHYKSGIFYDQSTAVGFKGSCNFTASGLIDNLEELDCYLSWEDTRSVSWIDEQQIYFNELYSGKSGFVEYINIEDVEIALKNEFANKDIEELLVQEKELIERKANLFENKYSRKIFEEVIASIEDIVTQPKFPYANGPREYQMEAYRNWSKNSFRGIFAMATGTGKTITSLNCVLNEIKKSQNHIYHVLILVPTITLVNQWVKEVRSFNFQDIYTISSKVDWETEVTTLLSTAKRIPVPFVIISTYASFSKPKFAQVLANLPADTILIADEGHNLASPAVKARLKDIQIQKRIGLSATPKRIYDPEGTIAMEEFFNDHEPFTYSFSMERAINEGVLCEYYYYPSIVKLSPDELTRYYEISNKLSQLNSIPKPSEHIQKQIERYRLERKRIINKASNKLNKTIDILKEVLNETGTLKYTFVYVPEGDSFEIREDGNEEVAENIKLVNQYTREIGSIRDNIYVNQFISGMKDRDEILRQFEQGKIDIITSMKCLDEGVDIPRAEKAIFCSSTGNPRQFIQRRGRILRKHKDKRFATIYDLVVVPDFESTVTSEAFFNIEKSLVRTELERVMYFASLSKNPYFTEEVFSEVCNHYNLNIYTIQTELATV